jgi:hypothetical protein
MMKVRGLASVAAVLGLAVAGIMVAPHDAQAWWRGGYGVYVPPVVVGPPVVYAPPPVYYAPPPVYYAPAPGYVAGPRVWIPPHWQGPYWVRGHWS